MVDLPDGRARTIVSRGIANRRMKRYAEAIVDFDRLVELSPEDKRTIACRGTSY